MLETEPIVCAVCACVCLCMCVEGCLWFESIQLLAQWDDVVVVAAVYIWSESNESVCVVTVWLTVCVCV